MLSGHGRRWMKQDYEPVSRIVLESALLAKAEGALQTTEHSSRSLLILSRGFFHPEPWSVRNSTVTDERLSGDEVELAAKLLRYKPDIEITPTIAGYFLKSRRIYFGGSLPSPYALETQEKTTSVHHCVIAKSCSSTDSNSVSFHLHQAEFDATEKNSPNRSASATRCCNVSYDNINMRLCGLAPLFQKIRLTLIFQCSQIRACEIWIPFKTSLGLLQCCHN